MATGGVLGNGVKVGFSANSPLSYTRVPGLMNVDQFFKLVRPLVDTTVHDPNSDIKTSMGGMADPPEIMFTLLADHDEITSPAHETVRVAQLSGSSFYWRFEVPVNRTKTRFRAYEFIGSVRDYDISELPIDGVQKTKVTLLYGGGYNVYPAGASALS